MRNMKLVKISLAILFSIIVLGFAESAVAYIRNLQLKRYASGFQAGRWRLLGETNHAKSVIKLYLKSGDKWLDISPAILTDGKTDAKGKIDEIIEKSQFKGGDVLKVAVGGEEAEITVPKKKDGGVVVPVDKVALLTPYIGLTSTIVVTTVAAAIYVKHVKRRKTKNT